MSSPARIVLVRRLMARLAKRPRRGFTLIELLVVVVIIGILASIALPSFVGAQDKARNAAVKGNLETVRMALEQYATDNNGSYPDASTGLMDMVGATAAATGYLPGNQIPKSPWSTSYQSTNLSVDSTTEIPAASIAAGSQMITLDSAIGVGKANAVSPTAETDYGAVTYDYDAGSQTYCVYGTGKKNKLAVVSAHLSNAGQ